MKSFRIIALSEGISYLLLPITMYLKYMQDYGLPNKIVGILHGILFVLYVGGSFYFFIKNKWPILQLLIVLLGSIIPFGTFYVDRKYLKD